MIKKLKRPTLRFEVFSLRATSLQGKKLVRLPSFSLRFNSLRFEES